MCFSPYLIRNHSLWSSSPSPRWRSSLSTKRHSLTHCSVFQKPPSCICLLMRPKTVGLLSMVELKEIFHLCLCVWLPVQPSVISMLDLIWLSKQAISLPGGQVSFMVRSFPYKGPFVRFCFWQKPSTVLVVYMPTKMDSLPLIIEMDMSPVHCSVSFFTWDQPQKTRSKTLHNVDLCRQNLWGRT